jgi:hypothetical protein
MYGVAMAVEKWSAWSMPPWRRDDSLAESVDPLRAGTGHWRTSLKG